MPRPPVKKTKKLAEAQAYGEEIGKIKALKKIKLQDALKVKLLDMIDRVDPLKLSTILMLTYLFKFALDNSEAWLKEKTTITSLSIISAFAALQGLLGIRNPDTSIVDVDFPDTFEYAICLSFAYLCVEKPELITEGASKIVDFAISLVKVIPK